jgi:hypothetical protein
MGTQRHVCSTAPQPPPPRPTPHHPGSPIGVCWLHPSCACNARPSVSRQPPSSFPGLAHQYPSGSLTNASPFILPSSGRLTNSTPSLLLCFGGFQRAQAGVCSVGVGLLRAQFEGAQGSFVRWRPSADQHVCCVLRALSSSPSSYPSGFSVSARLLTAPSCCHSLLKPLAGCIYIRHSQADVTKALGF